MFCRRVLVCEEERRQGDQEHPRQRKGILLTYFYSLLNIADLNRFRISASFHFELSEVEITWQVTHVRVLSNLK